MASLSKNATGSALGTRVKAKAPMACSLTNMGVRARIWECIIFTIRQDSVVSFKPKDFAEPSVFLCFRFPVFLCKQYHCNLPVIRQGFHIRKIHLRILASCEKLRASPKMFQSSFIYSRLKSLKRFK